MKYYNNELNLLHCSYENFLMQKCSRVCYHRDTCAKFVPKYSKCGRFHHGHRKQGGRGSPDHPTVCANFGLNLKLSTHAFCIYKSAWWLHLHLVEVPTANAGNWYGNKAHIHTVHVWEEHVDRCNPFLHRVSKNTSHFSYDVLMVSINYDHY